MNRRIFKRGGAETRRKIGRLEHGDDGSVGNVIGQPPTRSFSAPPRLRASASPRLKPWADNQGCSLGGVAEGSASAGLWAALCGSPPFPLRARNGFGQA